MKPVRACQPEGAFPCRLLQEGRSLLETASVSGKTPSVKVAAAEALAVLAFVGSEHPSDTLEVAQHLQSLWKGDAPTQAQEEAHQDLARPPCILAGQPQLAYCLYTPFHLHARLC